MEVEAYVQARYGRLLEHAIELGAPEGQAAAYVDEVLREQRRTIRRSDDPDPAVREALARMIQRRPQPSRAWIGVALVVGLAVVLGLVALLYSPPPKPLPSLFGYDGEQAASRLEEAGWQAVVRPARACEPIGLVLGTSPAVGTPVRRGEAVSIRTAVPSDDCLPVYAERTAGWAFIRWAEGLGPAPEFTDRVGVIVDGSDPATFTDGDAAVRERWGGTLRTIARAARVTAPTRSGMPSLDADRLVPPESTCGITRPPEGGERSALRVVIDARADGSDGRTAPEGGCSLTVDLYSFRGAIDSVVIYTGRTGDARD